MIGKWGLRQDLSWKGACIGENKMERVGQHLGETAEGPECEAEEYGVS